MATRRVFACGGRTRPVAGPGPRHGPHAERRAGGDLNVAAASVAAAGGHPSAVSAMTANPIQIPEEDPT